MAEAKDAKRVVTLDDIKCKEDNKLMAAISVIPIIGLIMFFVEKDDLFVRYYAGQFMFFLLFGVIGLIPVIGWICMPIFGLLVLVAMVMGFIKAMNCERFDVPVVSGWALKLMN